QASQAATSKAVGDLGTTLGTTITGAISGQQAALNTQLQQNAAGEATLFKTLTDWLTTAFGGVTSAQASLASSLQTTQTGVNALTGDATAKKRMEYLMLGSQSGASCLMPGTAGVAGNNAPDACMQTKAPFDGIPAQPSVAAGVTALQGLYGAAWNGSTFDLVKVGQAIAQKRGVDY